MTGSIIYRMLGLLGTVAMLAPASAEGPIGTLTRGTYVCELPGDASKQAGVLQPKAGFTIQSSSRYTAPQGKGTYLRRGNVLIMSTGPRRGERYQVASKGLVRKTESGAPSRLRCIRTAK